MRTTAAFRGVLQRLEHAPPWTLVAVFLLGGGAVTALMLAGYDEGGLPLVLLLGAYTVAAYRPAHEVVAAAGAMAVMLVAIVVGDVPGFGRNELLATLTAFGAAMLIGWTAQSRRQRIEALEHRQEEAGLRAAADERLRIARELHDVVAHSLGVIAVQAGVGMHVIDADPAEARRSFVNIADASRSSLAEIRRLLGDVRNADGMPTYAPAPGLADLPNLVREVAGAGLVVDFEVDGDTQRVPSGVGLAGYRIVQEALTNTIRHAHARRATVHLECTSEELQIEVTDDGRGPNGHGAQGHGLVGMRERVALYGGSLDTGPATGGGYRVAATLPFDSEAGS